MSESDSRSTTDGAGDAIAGWAAAERRGEPAACAAGWERGTKPMPRSCSMSASSLRQEPASTDVMIAFCRDFSARPFKLHVKRLALAATASHELCKDRYVI